MKKSQKFKEKVKKIVTCIILSLLAVIFYVQNNIIMDSEKVIEANNFNTNSQTTTVVIAEDGAIVCDSIVQGVRDCDLEDGNYIFRVTGNVSGTQETIDYPVELINYYDDVTYSLDEGETEKTVSLGDTTTEYKMLVVKYHKDLIVNKGVTLTATNIDDLTYKKGMYVCVLGELINNGTISMTARGTYNCEGENVYLWKNSNNSFEYIPAVGGQGGESIYRTWSATSSAEIAAPGNPGENGVNRSTGGGGSGGLRARIYDYSSGIRTSGAGAAGTAYSGGSGGGGINTNYGGNLAAENAMPNGGAGGAGYAYRGNKKWAARDVGGGAGNKGGMGKYTASSSLAGGNYAAFSGENGTGGLLVLYSNTLYNIGTISSNGSKGGIAFAGGGSSGGGSINIFANNILVSGTQTALGGIASGTVDLGGAGGDGTVTTIELNPHLNYTDKIIELTKGQNYQIDKNKLSYSNNDEFNANNLILEYEVMDDSIAKVDSSGNVNAIAEGSTKIKIIDRTKNIYTYVYLDVLDNIKADVQQGNNFSIALKKNGTVWSYGANSNGELGIGNNENKIEPTQITSLNDVKAIATGYSHSLALLENGQVYSWGAGMNGQLGNGTEVNSILPVKVDGISNIVKIDANKNMSIALSSDGIAYVWGEGYSILPMRVVFAEKVIDISGNLVLTEKRKVYDISNLSVPISGLNDIVKISCGNTHNLALAANGVLYAWGENKYGECGSETIGAFELKEIACDVLNISAGNGITIYKNQNGSVYVLGNNTEGQLGINTIASTFNDKILILDKKIENVSAGEGTHSSLIATDGFVWNTGLNTYGELGTGDNTNKTAFSQIGKTILVTNYEIKYLELDESFTITAKLENTFNLKRDLIDDNQDNFYVTMQDNENLSLNNKTITSLNYCTEIVTVCHNTETITKDIKIVSAMKMQSIVQGFRDMDLPDGEYSVVINEQPYTVELINYYDDVVYSEDIQLGDDTTDYKTLVVKYHKNLTINSGVTVTAKAVNDLTYKKGMYLCVLGNIYNNGTITMTARGTYNQEGENVYLWQNINDTYEYVPAYGGEGGEGIYCINTATASTDYFISGNAGENGENRATGGGGSGGLYARRYNYPSFISSSGSGAAGTAYSGGSAGGGLDVNYSGTLQAENASENGGPGGDAYAIRGETRWAERSAGGGAGNLGGMGKYTEYRAKLGTNKTANSGKNGTGGLLILYADTLYNSGTISSNGSKGGSGSIGGGSSGGGSINIFARIVAENGIQTADGGVISSATVPGGAGGNGSITINELGSLLNYNKKKIQLNIQDTYIVDKTKCSYTKLNEIQTEDLVVGNIVFESLDSSIATVDATGKITGINLGKTKIKITDTTNGYSTFIIVTVVKNGLVMPQIKEGKDFTITLKSNGTVWAYGLNENGQLGNNSNENSNTPIQVVTENMKYLNDIVDIGAGYKSGIALNNLGEVYTWGQYNYLDEFNVLKTEEQLYAKKEESLSNIIKVDSYKNNFYAVDASGKLFVWGEGFLEPTIVETAVSVDDISGDLILGEDGRVYLITNLLTPIRYISNVCEISCGEDHYLFVTLDGYVYSLGKGDLGQLGNGTNLEYSVPTLVKTQEEYLTNVASISAGSKTSMAVTEFGNVYVWGDNTNNKLGIVDKNILFATQITSVQDKNGDSIELDEIEIVETGFNHSSMADKNGYVYMVGLNNNGQLGTEDNNAREVFTKIGVVQIITKPERISIPINTQKEIAIALNNSFNLKSDITENGDVHLCNTNINEVTLEKINMVDNSEITNIDEFIPNYIVTGKKIGRVNIVANHKDEYKKNIWINVFENIDSDNLDWSNEFIKASSKIVNGNGFTIALRSDGTVWGFGKNENSQLGVSTINNTNKPEKIETSEIILDISSGENHTLLLGKSGKIYSFGMNRNGQLGTGNTSNYKNPIQIDLYDIEKVVANSNTSFAIDKDGIVYAWGEGYTKKPTKLDITYEIEKDGILEEKIRNIVDISKTYYLSDDGIVRLLKDNSEIKLSLNEYSSSEEPVLVNENVVQMSEGIDHLLLLGESGRVYSYGKNVYGQLGDKTTVGRQDLITTVVRIEDGSILENIVEISAGDKYGIATTRDGKVYTFGINGEKQLGFNNVLEDGGIQESGYARLKEDISNVVRVSAGYSHTIVYKNDGNVYSWGNGETGALGNGGNSNYWEAQKVGKNIVETNISEILLESNQTYDIDAWINYFNLFEEIESEIGYEVIDGNIAVISSETGEMMALNTGRTTVIAREKSSEKIAVIPVRVLAKGTKPANMNIIIEPQIETAGSHTVMLKSNGTVWSYGSGLYGELGNGKTEILDKPVQVNFPDGTIITKIAAGEYHCLALDSQGMVWSWGRNNYYQLGNKNDENLLVPTKITSLNDIKDITAGAYTSFAIDKNGEVYSFGLNANGECGIGDYTNKISVSKAKNVLDVIDIKAGKNHTIILKSTGEVLVTGSNLYGELGSDLDSRKVYEFTKVNDLNKVIAISAGDSNNIVINSEGNVYGWGANIYGELGIPNNIVVTKPTKIENSKNINYIEGGKGYNLAINNNQEVYAIGLNVSGELGNSSKNNIVELTKLNTIENVINVSAGNGYSLMLKADGTVWGCGDYTHGNENIKSKTKSTYPIQVGNEETSLNKTQLTIAVDESENIIEDFDYRFNLIYLDENFEDTLNYESLNEDIAVVVDDGTVTGKRVGTTRVNAISNIDGKIYSVLVNVVKTEDQVAPKVEAGSNFATVLRSDGNIWSFGYNADGRLSIGNSLTKDIPTKTNILTTYEDIKSGKDFVLALRTDGKVWSVGNNKNGQLGNGKTIAINKLAQIQNLEDVVKIAAGEDFGIALDSYGIVYGWGNNVDGQLGGKELGNIILKPISLDLNSKKIIDISAGRKQSVFVTANGNIFGYGNILNGELNSIQNPIKTQVTNDSIIILNGIGEVYEYKNGVSTIVNISEKVIDIFANDGSVMYQTANEKTYVTGENIAGELGTGDTENKNTPVLVNTHGENTYTLGVGYNNTYIIENTGNVYSAGNNEYGQLGNGTRENQVEHVLVGERFFEVEPKIEKMYVGDIEEIQISKNTFNVFGDKVNSSEEYDFQIDDLNVISESSGILTAEEKGTTNITITDKLTGDSFDITRIVAEPETDRIAQIMLDNEIATIAENSTDNDINYKVQIITNSNKAKLNITTNVLTDRISIDGGETWSYNGTLNQEIELTDKITELSIIVGIQNNNAEYPNELQYDLSIEKITDDIGIRKISVTSIDELGTETSIIATPVGLNRYEVAVKEWTNVSLVDVLANSEYSSISIDGLEYTLENQNKYIVIDNELTKEIKIAVKSEAGTETEYTLVVYKENALMNLESLKVNEQETTKISEGIYAIKVSEDVEIANIEAILENSLAKVNIADNEYKVKINTKQLTLENNTTQVSIKVAIDEKIKEYTLYIYKDIETELTPKLNMLLVNGRVIEPEIDGLTYITYLPSAEQEATIRAIADGITTKVQIEDNEQALGDSEKVVEIKNNINTFKIELVDEENKALEYNLIIKKAEADASIDKVYVSNGDTDIECKMLADGNYTVKVPRNYDNVDVTAIAKYPKAKVQIAETGNYIIEKDTQNIVLEDEQTQVKIMVQSEDLSNETECILTIEKYSNNTEIEKIYVDNEEVFISEDGNYHYILKEAKNNVLVKAVVDEISYVKIENTEYELSEIEKQVNILSKETEISIKVKAEDGTIKDHKLILESLPDDTNIEKVIVNGNIATYIEGQNRFEIRSEATEYNVEVVLSDLLATIKLGNNEETIGTDIITVEKSETETIVKVIVTSQNGLEEQEYIIAILEKSQNNNIDILKVNDVIINPNLEGNYKATIKNNVSEIDIEVLAEDIYAITTINSITNNSYSANITEDVIEGKTIYDYIITVVAEDGSTKEYTLEVEQLEANTNIINVLVGKDELGLENALMQDDGNYYYKIDRVENAFIKVELESLKSTLSINGESTEIINVNLAKEINTYPIRVVAEDGTIKECELVIEKKSNNTNIELISGQDVIEVDMKPTMSYVYVDEDASTIDLTITLESEFANLKLDTDTDYERNVITRTVDLTDYETNGVVDLNVAIEAEDGTQLDYLISIYKKANLDIETISVNSNILVYDDVNEKYFELVSNGNVPQVEIVLSNLMQTVQLLNNQGEVLATGIGTINTTLSLTDAITSYKIKVISHNGESYGVQEYSFEIRQKSNITDISYIKVDSLGTVEDKENLIYSSIVSGKEFYPIEVKLKDPNCSARLETLNGNILINNQVGVMTGEVAIQDGKTEEFVVVVTSENGEIKNYKLVIERVSSNLEIDSIEFTDYDIDETTIISKIVSDYNKEVKNYIIFVSPKLEETEITINANAEFTEITADSKHTAYKTLKFTKALNGSGITEVKLNLTAADGSKDTRYLQIVQLTDDIKIQNVEVDGVEIKANENYDYEATVSNEFDLSEIKVTLPIETSKVSINKNLAELQTSTVNVSKGNNRVLEIPIEVISETGVSYTYNLTLNIISHDTSVQAVIVDNNVSNLVDGKYVSYIDRNQAEVDLEIIAGVEYSTVTHTKEDNTVLSNKQELKFTLKTEDLTQEVYETTFNIVAEDGTTKEYTVSCIRKSDDNTIANVYVNESKIEANQGDLNYPDGTYYVIVSEDTAKIKIEANNEFAEVKFNNKTSIKELEQIITIKDEITVVPVIIKSQQGTEYETVIYIEKLSDNNNLDIINVNYKEAEKLSSNEYKAYIYDTDITAVVEIKSENEKANIIRTTENGDVLGNIQSQGVLNINIDTLEQTTKMYFKIVSPSGKESAVYTLNIEKMNTDTTLKELYVEGMLVQPDDNGIYNINLIETITEPTIKAITNHELAHVRILLGDEKLNISEQKITLSNNKQTIVPITVRSQSGVTEVIYLYITKISSKVALNTVTLNDKEADYYNDITSTYRFAVNPTETEFELFVLAEDDYTIFEYDGVEYLGSIKTAIALTENENGKTLRIKAKSEYGIEQIYTVEIAKKSTDILLEYLKVNNVLRNPDTEGGATYTVIIPKNATSTLFEVKTIYDYATIRLGDNVITTNSESKSVDCSDLTENRIVVPIVVTAADGITVKTYNVVLLRGSNDTSVELKVNEEILTSDNDGNYEIELPENIESIKVFAQALKEGIMGDYAKVDLNATGQYESPLKEVTISKEVYEGKEQIIIPLQVIAEDGTVRENVITVQFLKGTYITGKILTNNVNNKHTSTITIYKSSDTRIIGDELNPREEIVRLDTNEDGSFKALVYIENKSSMNDVDSNGIADELEEEYDLVVTKDGYLTYTVTNIQIEEFKETVLDEYNLIAGDVVKTEEIEIDDLVAVTDKFGINILSEEDENRIFDLNEDGIVNKLDIDILKANYGKKAETIKWENPNKLPNLNLTNSVNVIYTGYKQNQTQIVKQDFILPISCDYKITSQYGTRIHPVTGEEKKHTGIDISGTHHTEIYSIADGEVTFAGVQNGFGNCIEIKHVVNGETIYSFYAHLSRIDVEAGQTVTQGQTIGLEGGDPTLDPNPGSSTGHHLHFEIRKATGYGNDTNPMDYIKF